MSTPATTRHAQAAFVLCFLPALAHLRGVPLGELPALVAEGAAIIAGAPPAPGLPPPQGTPWFPLGARQRPLQGPAGAG